MFKSSFEQWEHGLPDGADTRVVRKRRFPMIFHNENMFIGIE
jgi:hypothetical protein